MHLGTQSQKRNPITKVFDADLGSCRSLPAAPNHTNADGCPSPSCRAAEPRVMCNQPEEWAPFTGGAIGVDLSYLRRTWFMAHKSFFHPTAQKQTQGCVTHLRPTYRRLLTRLSTFRCDAARQRADLLLPKHKKCCAACSQSSFFYLAASLPGDVSCCAKYDEPPVPPSSPDPPHIEACVCLVGRAGSMSSEVPLTAHRPNMLSLSRT